MKTYVMIACFAFILCSCTDDKCGEDINLGTLEFAEETRAFFPYTGEEVLIFQDQRGIRHTLRAREGLQLSDTRLFVNTLCRGNIDKLSFDDQEEYFQSQMEEIVYYDQSGEQVFYMRLQTLVENIDQSDTLAVYDLLSVSPSVKGQTFRSLNVVTSERQNDMSPSFKEVVVNNSVYIGDTLIMGKPYEEVYKSADFEGKYTLYSPLNGIIAFILGENEYWVLAE